MSYALLCSNMHCIAWHRNVTLRFTIGIRGIRGVLFSFKITRKRSLSQSKWPLSYFNFRDS